MVRGCVVVGCTTGVKGPSHSFPKSEWRCQDWIKAIASPNLFSIEPSELKKLRICHRHFTDDSYMEHGQRRRLKVTAIPTLFLVKGEKSFPLVLSVCNGGAATAQALDAGEIPPACHPPLLSLSESLSGKYGERFVGTVEIMPSHTEQNSILPNEIVMNAFECQQSPLSQSFSRTEIAVLTAQESLTTEVFLDSSYTSFTHGVSAITLPIIEPENVVLGNRTDSTLQPSPPVPLSSSAKRVLADESMLIAPRGKHSTLTGKSIIAPATRENMLSADAKRIYHNALRVRRRELKLRQKLKVAQRAKAKSRNLASVELAANGLTTIQQTFLQMQIRHGNISPQGRRYTDEEKLICLSMFKRSPSGYRHFMRLFSVPSPKTLKVMLARIPVKVGINKLLMSHLKDQATYMDPKEKMCAVVWDEMSLSAHLHYDKVQDKIIGFEDYGDRRTSKFADHCLVFMMRGIVNSWKIPLGYYFSESQTNGPQLTKCIKEMIKAVTNAGFNVVATVCDQGSSNISAINELRKMSDRIQWQNQRPNRDSIIIGSSEIIPIYDAPHLLKCIRNNLLDKKLEINVDLTSKKEPEYVTWDTIRLAYDIDIRANGTCRQVPKLTQAHVVPEKIHKMRVKHAAHVFSKRLSSFIGFLSNIDGYINTPHGRLKTPGKEGRIVSETIAFFNDLFDSVNGGKGGGDGNALKACIDKDSAHHKFWIEASRRLTKMRFVSKITNRPSKHVLALTNWRRTIRGLSSVWAKLQAAGVKSIKARNLNQDCIENFFGQVRSHGVRNINPTCYSFSASFKSLLINNITSSHSPRANCQEDSGEMMSLLNFFRSNQVPTEDVYLELDDQAILVDQNANTNHFQNKNIQNDTCEKVLMRILSSKALPNCTVCKESLVKHSNDQRFLDSIAHFEATIWKISYTRNLTKIIGPQLESAFGELECNDHGSLFRTKFILAIVESSLSSWCQKMNRILTGKSIDLDGNIISKLAVKQSYKWKQKMC